MKFLARLFLSLALLTGTGEAVFGQGKPERISFAKGKDRATLGGKVVGPQVREYAIRANKGQIMTVEVHSSNVNLGFTVTGPDGQNLMESETSGKASESLPETGDYVIRVMLSGEEGNRKGASADYILKVGIR